jgi:hypothetical protein
MKTSQGIGADGTPFQPYSTKHPYYYNPGTRGGKFWDKTHKEQQGAAKRMEKKLTGAGAKASVSSTGRTVKFASYAAFKAAFGRPGVDLMGVQAPHMLDAIVVSVNGRRSNQIDAKLWNDETFSAVQDDESPASAALIGIYDEEAAKRASGHQYGNRTLPIRRFFGISEDARAKVRDTLHRRLLMRARRALRGEG